MSWSKDAQSQHAARILQPAHLGQAVDQCPRYTAIANAHRVCPAQFRIKCLLVHGARDHGDSQQSLPLLSCTTLIALRLKRRSNARRSLRSSGAVPPWSAWHLGGAGPLQRRSCRDISPCCVAGQQVCVVVVSCIAHACPMKDLSAYRATPIPFHETCLSDGLRRCAQEEHPSCASARLLRPSLPHSKPWNRCV